MKWTESDIATFWEMKRGGATLVDIADRLGRKYSAVAKFSSKQSKKTTPKEDKPMIEGTKTTAAPEQKPVIESKPTPEPAPKLPKLDNAVSAALAMITAQGFVLDNFHVSMDGESASISICFLQEAPEDNA